MTLFCDRADFRIVRPLSAVQGSLAALQPKFRKPAWGGQPRPARSHDGTRADVALRSAVAWADLLGVSAAYVGFDDFGPNALHRIVAGPEASQQPAESRINQMEA